MCLTTKLTDFKEIDFFNKYVQMFEGYGSNNFS